MNGDDIFNIVDEKANSTNTDNVVRYCVKMAIKFYQHALKYKHIPEKQSSTWVHDIRKFSDEIAKTKPNSSDRQFQAEFIKQEGSMENVYNKGMKAVLNEDPNNSRCKNKQDIFNEFPTFNDIMNSQKVENFLHTYAYTDDAKNYLEENVAYEKWSVYSLIKEYKEEE